MVESMYFSWFKFSCVGFILTFSSTAFSADIRAAGATFPALLYQKWAQNYSVRKGVKVDYLAVGSGEGIKRIVANEVDFGGSDMPLAKEE